MPLIERDAAFSDNTGDNTRLRRARADRAHSAVAALCDPINFLAHLACGEESVPAAIHRRAAGMGSLAVKGNRVAFDTKGSEDRAQWKFQIKENRPLLDVKFKVSRGVFEFVATLFNTLEIHADFFQRSG